jgi:hypothetical protein
MKSIGQIVCCFLNSNQQHFLRTKGNQQHFSKTKGQTSFLQTFQSSKQIQLQNKASKNTLEKKQLQK